MRNCQNCTCLHSVSELTRNQQEDTRCSPFAEKYMSIVLAMEAGVASGHSRQSRASHGDDWPPLRGHDGHLHSGASPFLLRGKQNVHVDAL